MAETASVGSVRGLPASASLSDHDVYLLREGTHTRLYEKLGAHLRRDGKESGAAFAVWAPNAESVSVMGDFNGWERARHPLARFAPGTGLRLWHYLPEPSPRLAGGRRLGQSS